MNTKTILLKRVSLGDFVKILDFLHDDKLRAIANYGEIDLTPVMFWKNLSVRKEPDSPWGYISLEIELSAFEMPPEVKAFPNQIPAPSPEELKRLHEYSKKLVALNKKNFKEFEKMIKLLQ
ncbi:hypothetical protein ACFLZ4_01620 [Patescibacteria group bacterium]